MPSIDPIVSLFGSFGVWGLALFVFWKLSDRVLDAWREQRSKEEAAKKDQRDRELKRLDEVERLRQVEREAYREEQREHLEYLKELVVINRDQADKLAGFERALNTGDIEVRRTDPPKD